MARGTGNMLLAQWISEYAKKKKSLSLMINEISQKEKKM